jgi:hypothetical protein
VHTIDLEQVNPTVGVIKVGGREIVVTEPTVEQVILRAKAYDDYVKSLEGQELRDSEKEVAFLEWLKTEIHVMIPNLSIEEIGKMTLRQRKAVIAMFSPPETEEVEADSDPL